MFWPLLLPETDVNEAIRLEYEMYRLKCFIEEIKKEYPNASYTIDFFFKREDMKTIVHMQVHCLSYL